MLSKVKREVISLLARVRIRSEEEVAALEAQERAQAEAAARQMQFQHADSGGLGADEEAEQARLAQANAAAHTPVTRDGPKVGRTDPCPCGSGKKYTPSHAQLPCRPRHAGLRPLRPLRRSGPRPRRPRPHRRSGLRPRRTQPQTPQR